jgi:hypothetical protein
MTCDGKFITLSMPFQYTASIRSKPRRRTGNMFALRRMCLRTNCSCWNQMAASSMLGEETAIIRSRKHMLENATWLQWGQNMWKCSSFKFVTMSAAALVEERTPVLAKPITSCWFARPLVFPCVPGSDWLFASTGRMMARNMVILT